MWKYLIFNSVWFLFLFSCPFLKISHPRILAYLSITLVSAAMLLNPSTDPFAWVFYTLFSALVFRSALAWRPWAMAKSMALDQELELLSGELEKERFLLQNKNIETGELGQNADQIYHLYEKVKEMSQSLDKLETFLILGEALSRYFKFRSIKLAIFGEENARPQSPEEVFELHDFDFEGLFDKNLFLKERSKVVSSFSLFDKKVSEAVFKKKALLDTVTAGSPEDSEKEEIRQRPDFTPFIAQPILIEEKIFAVLVLSGVEVRQLPVISILTDAFTAELQRIKLYEKVEALASTDGLTGVFVRRHLLERLAAEITRSKKFGFKLSFLMIDIDHFKQFNDHYGHLVGDVVLKQVAETIRKSTREIDIVGRHGGEEFGVILIETDDSGAFFVAERIRHAVAERIFKAYDENLKVTISIGCSTYSQKLHDLGALVDAADGALYQAKREGRNRVCSANVSTPA
jgi:diguanylate cyclase (GGDEF)-like protein